MMATQPILKVRAEFTHDGKDYALGMEVADDERTNIQRFKALLFSMRRTWDALENGSYPREAG